MAYSEVGPVIQTLGGEQAWNGELQMDMAAPGSAPAAPPAVQKLPLFLNLPRELRDQIYDYVFSLPDTRPDRSLRIERRHMKYFTPTPATILLTLHHEELLLNRQICEEALEKLFKKHTVYLSCGPFVLKTFLSRIANDVPNARGKRWLRWMKRIELDWVTFPNLRNYPPDREDGKDEWWWENDGQEVDVDYLPREAQLDRRYDEYAYENSTHYDDNLYDPASVSLYPAFPSRASAQPNAHTLPPTSDPFGFASHYPFADPLRGPSTDEHSQRLADAEGDAPDDIKVKLDMLIAMEVAPLFAYLATPAFALHSITLPLYFISKRTYQNRHAARPGYALPLKVRYWCQVVVHALAMLLTHPTTTGATRLAEVRVLYRPWDVWASMDPSDDLERLVHEGVWFRGPDPPGRDGEGEAFKAVWRALEERGFDIEDEGLRAEIHKVEWDGELETRVGDSLEVVFTRGE